MKKTDFNNKFKKLARKVSSNEAKLVETENKIIDLTEKIAQI